MESNGLTRRMYTNMGGGILGLEMPSHPQIDQTQLSIKQPNYLYNNKPSPKLSKSEEEEANDQEDSSSDIKRKGDGGGNASMWQRMKWSDNMVRLLIMAVYYIGDEAETGAEKKRGCALQKKGKWKSVSKAMMEKGFYVSPQQCEDKFNDLNKRFKRVNDILGRGTACNVVENHSLLETMRIEPKSKDEVKKLLNSKHLFFREMCAYHNTCSANNTNTNTPTLEAAQHQQLSEPSCSHPTLAHNSYSVEEEDDEDDEVEDHHHEEGGVSSKRARTTMEGEGVSGKGAKGGLDQWNGQVMGMLEDGRKSTWEKKHWVMTQLLELEENGIKIQREALELEKERLKWIKFSSNKEREMERMKIDNEKKRLENARMLLLLRRKEIHFLYLKFQTPCK